MNSIWSVTAALLCASVAQAQLTPVRYPAGHHELAVRGWFQGEEMEPWEAEYSIGDTLVDGKPALRATYNSRRLGDKWVYHYVATWTPRGDVTARWVNGRPEPNSCDLSAAAGRISGKTSSGGAPSASFTGTAIPDFALGAYVSTLSLDDGATVQLTVFRCLAGAQNSVVMNQFNGTVRSGKARRGWGDWEPAWIVEGSKEYPARITIAKSDRLVLHTITIQGSVGRSEDSFVGTARPKH